MGRMDVNLMRYLEPEHFRVLVAVEMGMKNHEMVPLALVSAIARIHRGAVSKILGDLVKHSLIGFERGKKYDGYRLTVRGYDFLALRALCARGVVGSVGNQIGVGKESDVYVGGDAELEDLCLKFHRLGRTSFRKIKEKRDYHKKRQNASWLYLGRLAAQKEFAFLAALAARGFPVPRPVDVCRHVVVMGLIDGKTLCHVDAVEEPAELYHKLMSLIMKFASYGLIHGDFNEFNLMLLKDDKIVVIDFPQMVSTDHPNADFYFNRDVECIRTFFRRKFNFDSDDFPTWEEAQEMGKKHDLDVELEASGFTKAMAKDLNKAYDEGDFGAHKDEGEEGEEDEEESDDGREEDIPEEDEDVDEEERKEEEKEAVRSKRQLELSSRFDTWLAEASEQAAAEGEEILDEECPQLVEHAHEILPEDIERVREREKAREAEEREEREAAERAESVAEVEKPEKQKKKVATGSRSVTSYTSTIPPEEIRKRVQMELKRNKDKVKMRAKGKQSAVSRGRKDNQTTIGEYAGWDF